MPKTETDTTYRSYIRDAIRTESDHMAAFARICNDPRLLRLIHGAFGLQTEVGEFVDPIKCFLFYGKNLDVENLKEELGDLFWYLAIICDALGEKNFNRALQANIRKLRARYPEKFTESAAQNRDTKAEAQALQGKHRFEPGHPIYGPKCCKICGHEQEKGPHIDEPF